MDLISLFIEEFPIEIALLSEEALLGANDFLLLEEFISLEALFLYELAGII